MTTIMFDPKCPSCGSHQVFERYDATDPNDGQTWECDKCGNAWDDSNSWNEEPPEPDFGVEWQPT